MIVNKAIATKTADYLLQIKAINLQPTNPFTWASGLKSPIYCDNRKILSFPKVRKFVKNQIVSIINDNHGDVDMIAGVATGGIALGAIVADELDLPFVYVRSSSKKHGMQNQVEGDISQGNKILVFEDLVSTGMSSLDAVDCIRETEKNIIGMIAIFSYAFDSTVKRFSEASCPLITLSDYPSLIESLDQNDQLNDEQKQHLLNWRNDPENWMSA